jgi:hypothetical protein
MFELAICDERRALGESIIRDYFDHVVGDVCERARTLLDFTDILDEEHRRCVSKVANQFIQSIRDAEAANFAAYDPDWRRRADLFPAQFCFLIENYYLPREVDHAAEEDITDEKHEWNVNKFDLGCLVFTDEFICDEEIYDLKMTLSLSVENRHLLAHFFNVDDFYSVKVGLDERSR